MANSRRKTTMNISISTDTKERLRLFAEQHHTNISQAITDWIWSTPVDMPKDAAEGSDDE